MAKDKLQAIKRRYGVIGNSEALNRALYTAARVAPTNLSVLITGESGVGKEVFSKVIHQLSLRKHGPFLAINCGSLPKGTINSELFGHEKGSFTGASGERKGYFETMNGGTLFLDEIGEMPLNTQAYLLRVLESGEFIRMGSSKILKSDVRVVAATNVSLEQSIKSGKFREDLYYRLNTVPIQVPALYQRPEDIYLLFRKFAADFGEKYNSPTIRLDDDARKIIEHYRWPGNVRELKNLVEQLSVMAEDQHVGALELLDLAPHLRKRNLPSLAEDQGSENHFSGHYERDLLYKLLFDMRNDVTELKKMIFDMVKINNLSVPDSAILHSTPQSNYDPMTPSSSFPVSTNYTSQSFNEERDKPFIVSPNEYDDSEIIEENLSLESMERTMIKKALEKYSGRRKDAAEELGISERTLYRKIKQYDLG